MIEFTAIECKLSNTKALEATKEKIQALEASQHESQEDWHEFITDVKSEMLTKDIVHLVECRYSHILAFKHTNNLVKQIRKSNQKRSAVAAAKAMESQPSNMVLVVSQPLKKLGPLSNVKPRNASMRHWPS